MSKLTIELNGRALDVAKAIDISLPIDFGMPHERAWYIGPPSREPVVLGNWISSTEAGGNVNFFNLNINPHAHGTHIETYWHVQHHHPVPPQINQWFLPGFLFSAQPDTDGALDLNALWNAIPLNTQALIIRTLPNDASKKSKKYSQTNPPYISASDAGKIALAGITTLLIDLPSVDPESDNGLLVSHKAFWDHQIKGTEQKAIIGELLYIPDSVTDGEYVVHIQHPPLINDAIPARVFLIPYI